MRRQTPLKLTLCLLLLLLVVPVLATERGVKRTDAAPSADRLALVIGNAEYSEAGRLRNPVNDARAMSRTLGGLGFSVTSLENADRRGMETAIRQFGKTLRRQGGVGLFYYAGHGMQIEGENYLVPVDANPSTETDVQYDAVPLGKLLGQLKAAENGMNLVILDACRNNPFSRSFRTNRSGLAQVTAPSGTFISYATAPGSVAADGEGENGLFTEKLIAHMRTPGLKLEEVFKRVRGAVKDESMGKQVPWDSSSVTGDFFFLPSGARPAPPASAAAPAPQAASVSAIRADEEAWKMLADSEDPEDFRFFIESFPQSQLRKTAEFKLRQLNRKQAKAESERLARQEEERQRQEAEQKRLAEAKRKAEAERKRQEELAALKRKQESEGVWVEEHTGMKFRRIPGGSFRMGSPSTEAGRDDDETPHTVRVGEFRLAETEVTVGQFRQFVRESGHSADSVWEGCWWWTGSKWEESMRKNWKSPGFSQGESHPVACVSWHDAVAYAQWLSRKTGKRFRLPTEAEWEYAARAGTRTARWWGEDPDGACRHASVADRATKRKLGWGWTVHDCEDGYEATAPVGSFRANAFGLFDMLGNVWEWTCSEHADYGEGKENRCISNNRAKNSSLRRSLRGGSWFDRPRFVRSADRYGLEPGYRDFYLGFRLAQD